MRRNANLVLFLSRPNNSGEPAGHLTCPVDWSRDPTRRGRGGKSRSEGERT